MTVRINFQTAQVSFKSEDKVIIYFTCGRLGNVNIILRELE